VLGGALLLVGLLAGYRILDAVGDLRAARSLLETAGDAIEDGRIADGQAALAQASSRLAKAQSSLSKGRLELDVVRALPIAGDNLVDLRRSITYANQLSNGGSRILLAADSLVGPTGRLDVGLAHGEVPLQPLAAALGEIDLLRTSLPGTDDLDRDPGVLLGPVKSLHDRVEAEVVRRRDQLETLSDALNLLYEMAGGRGDRGYLIAVANTAEMRGSGGMILNYGGLVGINGTFSLPRFGRIDDLALSKGISATGTPEDYLTRWDGFDPLRLWRNANLAADFTVVAPVLEDMAVAATNRPIDGVIQIDPQGLAAILEGVGPVEIDEVGTIDADNLVDIVLHDAYVKYPGIQARSDVLEEVARAAFTRLVEGDYPSLRPLGAALVEAVRGRHIMMHTRSEGSEGNLRALGADGSLPEARGPDSFALTVQNVSANKLDYFVDTAVELSGDRAPGLPSRVKAKIVVRSSAPPGVTTPKYVFGPFDGTQVAGLYRGVVSLYLPAGTNVVKTSGDATRYPPVAVTEDGRPVVSYTIDLPAGQRHELDVELELAPRKDGPYELILVPSPRVRPTTWRLELQTGRGLLSRTLELTTSVRVPADAEPGPWQPDDER
jgi:hypothetical protein